MKITKIIETAITVAAVAGLVTVFPISGMMAVEILIGGAFVTMVALETKKRCF